MASPKTPEADRQSAEDEPSSNTDQPEETHQKVTEVKISVCEQIEESPNDDEKALQKLLAVYEQIKKQQNTEQGASEKPSNTESPELEWNKGHGLKYGFFDKLCADNSPENIKSQFRAVCDARSKLAGNEKMSSEKKTECLQFLIDMGVEDFSNMTLSWASLIKADLIKAKLCEADLRGARLILADLSGAKLIEADLSKADLIEAKLIEADLSGAKLIKATLIWAKLIGADLREAWLIEAKLIEAKLIGADLREAWLIETDLSGAKLSEADLRGADLIKAKLSGADLSDVIVDDETDLTLVKIDDQTLQSAPKDFQQRYHACNPNVTSSQRDKNTI